MIIKINPDTGMQDCETCHKQFLGRHKCSKIPLKFIDLFAGIGGFRLALEGLNWKCVFSSEIDPKAREVYKANFGEYPSGDITTTVADDIPDHDVLCGGFPCQPFSVISTKREGINDDRGVLFNDVCRVLLRKQPRAFILENVPGLLTAQNGLAWSIICQSLFEAGYTLRISLMDAKHYNIPQSRSRLFIIGYRDDLGLTPFDIRTPGGIPLTLFLNDLLEPDTSVSYLKPQPKLRDSATFYTDKTQRPDRSQAHQDRTKCRTVGFLPDVRFKVRAKVLDSRHISQTIDATGPFHIQTPAGIRRLTTREMFRLQGFPDDFKTLYDTPRLIGNAVCIPVVAALGLFVQKQFRSFKLTK